MAFNGIKYIKNVTKSFGYAMVDVVGDMSPAIKSFTESNEELGKELYASVKDWKGTVKKMKTSVVESDVYEFAKAYKDNLFDDLKNGTFYNKSRIEDYEVKLGGMDDETLKAEFSDMFDDDDINFDDWDEDDLRSDLFMADTMDEVGMKIAESNAEVTTRSAEYIVKGQKESTKILYEQNNKLMGQALQGMAAINANIGQLSGLPSLMEVQANNSSKFFETTTGQLNRVIELLEHISTSVDTAPEQEQENEDAPLTFSDIVDSKGMPNLKKYFKNVQGNIKKVIDENGGGMLGNLFGGGNVLMAFAASPLEELTKTAVKQLVPKIVENSVSQFNDTLQGFFGSMISKINKGADSDSPIMNWVQKILGIDSELSTTIDPSQYNKGKVAWDGASRKALVEIIPAQLSKIVSALTGEAPMVFDPKSGTMVAVSRLYNEASTKIQRSADFAAMDFRSAVEDIMRRGKYSFESYGSKESFDNSLDMFIKAAFENGGIDQQSLRKDSNDYRRGMQNIGMGDTKLFERIFSIMKRDPKYKNVLLKYNKRILNERDSLTRRTKYDQENGSIESILNSGMFNDFIDNEEKEENKKLRKAGYDSFESIAGVQTFAKQIDNYGNNVFYYLQEILKREDKMYQYQGIMLDNWGASGSGYNIQVQQDNLDDSTTKNNKHGTRNRSKRKSKKNSRVKLVFDKALGNVENNEDERKKTADYYLTKYTQERSASYINERDRFRSDKENADYVNSSSDDDLNQFELNFDASRLRDEIYEEKGEKNFVDKLLKEKTLKGKFEAIQEKVQSYLNKPLIAFSEMIDGANDKLFQLIYGDGDKELEDKGVLGVLKDSIHNTFESINTWIDEKILSPIKAKLDIKNAGDLGRKIFDKFGWDYDEFIRKKKEGIFGKYDSETKRRSGGLLGDYVQDVKDNAKDSWEWIKGGVGDVFGGFKNSAIGNVIGSFRPSEVSTGGPSHYFKGGTVDKTGIAAVSEGEIIIPSELNPYYHGKTDKKQQIKAENEAVKKFFGGFAPGGSPGATEAEVENGSDKVAIDLAIEDQTELIKRSGVGADTIRNYLNSIKPGKMDDNKRIDYYIRNLKKYVRRVSKMRKKLKGQEAQIADFNNDKKVYRMNDGTVYTMEDNQYVTKSAKDKKNHLMQLGENDFLGQMTDELFSAAKSTIDAIKPDNRKGSKDPENAAFSMAMDDVKDNFKSYAGAMTVGGGIGAAASLITGMFGGPLLGAAVGSAVGLTMKSDKVQNWLFGEDVDDGKGGTTHKEGALSEKTTKFIKEQLPELAKFGLVGGAAGTLIGHPVLGTLVGSAVGYAKKSEKFSKFIFTGVDEDGHQHKGLLNMTQEEFEKKMQKRLPKMAAGAVAGAMIGPFGGIIPNLLIGSAVGFASDTDKFKDLMFGKEIPDGKGGTKREGGILGTIKNAVVTPFLNLGKDIGKNYAKWFKEQVGDPIAKSIEPITHHLGTLGSRFGKWVVNLFKTKGRRLIPRFARNALDKGERLVGGAVKGVLGATKFPLKFVANRFTSAAEKSRAKDILAGYTDDMDLDEVMDQFENNKYLNGESQKYMKEGQQANPYYQLYSTLQGMNKEQLKGFRDTVVGVDNATDSYKNKRQDIINNMYDNMLADYNIRPGDKSKLVKQLAKGKINEENIDEYLSSMRSSFGHSYSNKDVANMKNILLSGNQQLKDLDKIYSAKDENGKSLYKLKQEDIIKDALAKFGMDKEDIAVFMTDPKMRERATAIIDNSISRYDLQEDARAKERMKEMEGKNPEETAAQATKEMDENLRKKNDEMIELLKKSVNYLAKITGEGNVFDDSGNYINPGDRVIARTSSSAAPNLDLIGPNHGTNNTKKSGNNDSKSEVSETEVDDSTISNIIGDAAASPVTAAIGGRIKKSGYAALSKGELIIPKKFAKKFYGNFALGGMIGGPQKFINTPEGRYIFDAESNEYEAADSETRAAEAKKSEYQDAVISIPGKIDNLNEALGGRGGDQEKKEEDQNSGILSEIMSSLGLGNSSMGQLITKIIGFGGKGIKSLIGPLLAAGVTISFFKGDFDQVLSDAGKNILTSVLGLDDVESKETLEANLSQEGKNGEAGASDIVAKGALRSFLKGGKGLSKTTEFLSKHGLGITKKFFGGANKIANGTESLYTKAINGIASKITGKSVEELSEISLGGLAKNAMESTETGANILGKVDDVISGGKNKIAEVKNAFKGFGKKAAKDGTEEAAEAATKKTFKQTMKEAGKKSVNKLFKAIKKKLPAGVQKILPSMADDLAEEAAEQATKKAAKEGTESALKMIPIVGQAISVAFAVVDFTDGYTKASSILGIEDPSEGECIIAGLVNCLLGLAFPISLIPVKTMVTILADKVLPAMGVDNKEFLDKRETFASKVSEYNEKNGTDYSVEQYNSVVRNEKTAYGTAFSNMRAVFDKTYRNKLVNGTDDEGNLISGYIDTNTARWKYWKSKINGGLDSEYAQVLYINECLHDSSLGLSKDRIADYKDRIAAYKATAGAKEVPEIKKDLYGLIKTGSVSSKGWAKAKMFGLGSAAPMLGGLLKSNADYGDGVSSDSYVDENTEGGGAGKSIDGYAAGGVVKKTGLASLSKGELITKSPKEAISAIFEKLFGGGKSSIDTAKDYEDSTDMASFVSDLMSFDPEKDSWKGFWSKADKDSDGNPLGKVIKRIIASMVAPIFALGKSMETVSGVLGVSLGVSEANSSSSSTITSSGKKSVLTTIKDNTKSAFGKAKDKVSGVLSNIGNGIKKLFGGASGNVVGGVENFDSADGSFISQFSSKYKNLKYGDSTFSEEGCAPATAAMFLNNAGVNQTAEEAANFAVNKGYKVKNDGTKDAFFKDYFNSKGIPTAQAGNSKAIYDSLSSGKPVVMLGQDSANTSKKNSPFGKNPHYVLATGLDSNGNIIVNDPEARKGGLKYKKNILDKVKSGITTKLAGGNSGIFQRYGGGDVAAQVWYYLKQNGFTEQAAAGVMGNLKQETGMNPACEVKNVTCGIACWDYQNGKSALKEAAQKAGVKWTDLGFQLDYLMKGLPAAFNSYTGKQPHYYSTGEWCWWPKKMTFDEFKALTSVNDATEIFERVYERASKPNIANRQKYANEYYKQFTGKDGEPVSYTGATGTDTTSDSSESSSGSDFNSIISGAFNKFLGGIYGDKLVNLVGGDNTSADVGSADDGSTTTSSSTTTATVTTADGATVSQSTTIGKDVAEDAANYIGGKYVWGGNTLGKGVDCSGFVQQLYKKHGFNIPKRRSTDMFSDTSTGTTITGGTYKDLKPGDAMFFSNNGKPGGVHHVGIYAGNGHMIHAQSTKTGIVDTDLSKSSSYQKEYIGAKRFGSGSGIIDPNRVVSAKKLFGGGSTGKQINMNNAVQVKRAANQEAEIQSQIENAKSSRTQTSTSKRNSENFNQLISLLKQIAENTSTIATICDLIKKIANIDNNGNSTNSNTTKPSTQSKSVDYDVSSNENDMADLVSTLLALAQA